MHKDESEDVLVPKQDVLLTKQRVVSQLKEKQNDTQDGDENRKLMGKTEPSCPMQDIHKTFEECKFGRFHIRLLVTSFIAQIASLLVSLSTSYLLPIAECDLDMNLKEKGLLTSMPIMGVFISNVISGFMIDSFGRIIFLKIGYFGLFIFNILSACSQNFEMFAAAKFGEGLLSGIANSAIMPITAEFCHPDVRDRVMLCQSAVAAVAQIICPAMAWAFLIHDWEWSVSGTFVFKTWNFYLLAMSSWALVGYIFYTTIPESPKFLVTRKKYLEARNILTTVYVENTGKNAETFPYRDIWEQEIQEQANIKVIEKTSLQQFQDQVVAGLRNMRPLLHRPLLAYIVILAAMQLLIVGMYDVLRLWFPQLSTIVEHYDINGHQNLCVLLDNYTATENARVMPSTSMKTTEVSEVCVPHISGAETYIDSIIIGLVWTIPYFISGIVVNKVGKKRLLMLSGVICIGALCGIRWAFSKTMMVAFFSIDIAVMQTMKSLGQVVQVEVFPTAMRSLAMALISVISRIGSLLGNIGFPILLDLGCAIPFYIMIGMMISLILMAIFTPKEKEG